MAFDLVAAFFVIVVAAVSYGLALRAYPSDLRQSLWLAFALHIAAAYFNLWLYTSYYRGGDILNYLRFGKQLADFVSLNLVERVPELLAVIFQGHPRLPGVASTGLTSTDTMTGFAAALWLLLGSGAAGNLAVSLFSLSGQLALFSALRAHFPGPLHRRLLYACVLLPSVIVWSSGVIKESFALTGLGWMLFGFTSVLGPRRLRGLLLLGCGAVLVSISKAYVLFPFVAGAGAWLYWRRALARSGGAVRIRPLAFVLAAGIAVGGVFALGKVFPRYALDNLGKEAARLQYYGAIEKGGSTYEIGNAKERSLFGQLAYAPLGVASALFRPFPHEVRSFTMAINALETTLLNGMFLWLLVSGRLGRTVDAVRRSPALIFCVVFVLLFSVAVGLTTTNLGALSRYRMPMTPMYATLLFVALARKEQARRLEAAPRSASLGRAPALRLAPSAALAPRPSGGELAQPASNHAWNISTDQSR